MSGTIRTLVMLLIILALMAGCTQATPTSAPLTSSESTAAPAGEIVLTFTGKVKHELTLSMADLEGLGTVQKTLEHPKDGKQSYTGVLLSTLLEQAQPDPGTTLAITASDGYSVVVAIEDAKACADCLIAFTEGSLRLLMPGFGSSFWVKDVASIEAK